MNTLSRKGSALAVTMLFLGALTVIVMSVLTLAYSTYRLSMRNNVRAEARAVAESELEALYYKFADKVRTGTLPAAVPAALAASTDTGDQPATLDRAGFLEAHRQTGWQVGRSIKVSDSFRGIMPSSTKVGTFRNVETRVVVQPPATGPWAGSGLAMRVGRVMTAGRATIFQVCLFYQGTNLELAPNGTTTILGDIICNGSVFLASAGSTSQLNLPMKVYYLQGGVFNKRSWGDDGAWDPPDDPTPDDVASLYDPQSTVPTGTLLEPNWTGDGQAAQLKVLTAPENLLGGADAETIARNNPALFGPLGDDGKVTPEALNNVYRSVLVPPPSAAGSNEYSSPTLPDDPTISAQRAYNKAGLIITVENGTATITRVINGVPETTPVTYTDVISDPISMWDARENRAIAITEIDIGKLKSFVGVGGSNYTNFNGLVYVNLKTGNADSPSAVRLVNAETLPVTKTIDDNGDNGGFSLVTNGGLYIKGSYNTTKVEDSTHTEVTAPSMLMADAITVLSDNWDDSLAHTDTPNERVALSNDTVSAADTTLTKWTTINAGLLTGSVASSSTAYSGGAQNLVRYLEDWYNGDQKVKLNGSFGRLFSPRFFTRNWVDPSNATGRYYFQPRERLLQFDTSMVEDTPPGSPEISNLGRGRFFFW